MYIKISSGIKMAGNFGDIFQGKKYASYKLGNVVNKLQFTISK